MGNKFIGRLCDIGIAKEASRGAGAAATFWLPKSSENLQDKVIKARSRLNYGTIDAGGNLAPVAKRRAEGTIDFDLLSESFGLFLLNMFGTVNTTNQGDGTYKHTFSLQNDAIHDSLCIMLADPNGVKQFKNVMVDSIVINAVPDDVVKVTAEIKAKSHDDAAGSASYTAEKKFLGRHLKLYIAAGTGSLAAASNIPVKKLTLTMKQNTMFDDNCGTIQPSDILNQQLEISGSIELNLEDDTYLDYMREGDYKAMRISVISDQQIGSGSETPEFTIDLSRVDFDGFEPNRAIDEIAKQTINFNALFDTSNGNVVNSLYLINITASY